MKTFVISLIKLFVFDELQYIFIFFAVTMNSPVFFPIAFVTRENY